MYDLYPIITKSIESGKVKISDISYLLNESEEIIVEKLSGVKEFNINEAMTLNRELFKDIPFEELFKTK